MEKLWRETSELMWQRPLLWLPVLAADLLAFLVNLGSGALVRKFVLGSLQYRSALGGAPVRGPVSTAAVQHATLVALLITWPANFLRLLLYATAFIVTAALVRDVMTRARKPAAAAGEALLRSSGGILSLSLRALAIYACAGVLLDWLGKWLLAHGHKATLLSGWVETGAGVLVFAVLAWLVAPTAVQVLAHRYPASEPRRHAQIFAFVLGVISLLLSRFVVSNMRSVHIASPVASFALELTGSWISALPYAVLFVALARIALRVESEAESSPAHVDTLTEHGPNP